MSERRNEDKPWVENYPPLANWLDGIDAACQEQLPMGDPERPTAYVEKWLTPSGRAFIVEVRANRMGWNIFTDSGTGDIASTLADAEKRLGL